MNKPIIVTTLIIIFGLLFVGFLLLGRKKSSHTFLKASRLEESGQSEEACYTFALAARQGAKAKDCRLRIKSLWFNHGPFHFSKQLENAKKEYAGDGDGHSEGYHETIVDYIQRTVSSKE